MSRGFCLPELAITVLTGVIVTTVALPVYQRTLLVEHLLTAKALHGGMYECRYRSIGGAESTYYQKHECEETHEVKQ